MKFATSTVALVLAAVAQAHGKVMNKAQSAALQFQFTHDEGCDGPIVATKKFVATGKCAPFSSNGAFGAEVMNLLSRNVTLSLFSDTNCTSADQIFQNPPLVPGTFQCYADIAAANSINVTLS